jgi:serine O-acetyltransferase
LYRGAKRHPTLGARVVVGAGAQVLGGFTVGEGARVGSNAVVVKPVPPGVTAVGNPARLIEPGRSEAREAKAREMGFSAYGVTADADDPMSKAIHGLLDHAVETDRRLKALLASLEKSGVVLDESLASKDAFDPNYLGKIVD